MRSRKDQKVLLATPHGHDVSARWTKCVLNLVAWDMNHHGRIVRGGNFALNSSGANVTNARNEIVRAFLATDIDWLWFCDTDMTFEPDTLDRLVDAAHPRERPIMGALCFSLQDGYRAAPTLYVIREDRKVGRMLDYPFGQRVRSLTGTGCLLIHRSALETIRDRNFDPAYPWFQETRVGDMQAGEDLTFCIRAEALGIPVHVDTSIKCGHEKPFIVDEQMYLAQRAAGTVEVGDPLVPTYAVIASRTRPEMLATLRAQLAPQVTGMFVYDNGYPSPPPDTIPAHGWALHRMWNDGLNRAQDAASGPHNVLVINDDVEVPDDFVARLDAALRADDDHWIAYPNHHGLDLQPGEVARTQTDKLAGQTISGWAFLLRGETGLRFDERFGFWYGDSDLERQVRQAGKHVVCVGGCHARHLDPMRSTLDNPDRLAQAEHDELEFAQKWGLDPDSLWLAQNRARL